MDEPTKTVDAIADNDDAAGAARRESELRYRLVLEAASDLIWDWNLITNEVTRNRGIQMLFGYSDDQIRSDASWGRARLHPQDRERVMRNLLAAIEEGRESWQDEYRFRRADGSYAQVQGRGRIVRDPAGKAVRMVGSMTDLSHRQESERALRESKERLHLATQTGKVGIWDWDVVADRIIWSEALFQIHGVSPDEFDGTVEGLARWSTRRTGISFRETFKRRCATARLMNWNSAPCGPTAK